MSQYVDVEALTRVLVLSLVFGAGVPAVFALGVRVLAPAGRGASGSAAGVVRLAWWRRVVGVLCFAVCAAAVVAGVAKLVVGSS
ncbi:MAG: hypothetical protein AAGC49_00560 [Brevundimonas sp.]